MLQEPVKPKRSPRGTDTSRARTRRASSRIERLPAIDKAEKARSITVRALDGKEYAIEPLPDDPSEATYSAGMDAILQGIKGTPR